MEKKLKSLSKRMDEFLQALIDRQKRKEVVRGCYKRSAKRKGIKEEGRKKKKRGRNVLEFGGSDRKEKKKEGKKEKKGTCGGEKKRGKKKEKRRKYGTCVGEKKKRGKKKRKKRRRKCYHYIFTINFK